MAPSTYYAAKSRLPSARAQRDAVMTPVVRALWEDNYRVYGERKIWKAARRGGHDVGRDQVARFMRTAGIEGVRRTKRVRTTKADPGVPRHPDLVGRDFTATGPNQLWVTDLSYVPTWAGVAYVCFIIDAYSRMIVGWRVAGHMRTTMVLDAIEMARCHAAPNWRGCGVTRTQAVNSPRFATANGWPRSVRCPRSARSAAMESFFALLQKNVLDTRRWSTRHELRLAIVTWIEKTYHRRRRQRPLGKLTPIKFETIYSAAHAA